MAKLSDVFILQMGKTPSRADSRYWENACNKWVSISDLTSYDMYVGDTKEKISEIAVKESGIKVVPPNTVIMSFKLTLGKTAITVEPIFTNEAIMAFIPTGRYEISPKYFYFYFGSRNWNRGTNRAVMGITLNKATLNNMMIDVPPLDIQRKIAATLDKVTHLIDLCKQQLETLDLLVKSRFIGMFGEPITNTKRLETKILKEVLLLKAGDFTIASDISNEPTELSKYPCYGGNGIRGYVAEYNQEGDYSLIGRQGALSGNVQYAKGKFKNTEHALLVTPIIEMNSIWLNQLLINLDLKRFQTGAAQPGLSVKNLQNIPIISVPLDMQNQFAAFVEATDKSKLAVQKQLETLETLKKSLMQEYFG